MPTSGCHTMSETTTMQREAVSPIEQHISPRSRLKTGIESLNDGIPPFYEPSMRARLGTAASSPQCLPSSSPFATPARQRMARRPDLEAGSYLRLIDSCITQLKAQGPARTCNESKEDLEGSVGVVSDFGCWSGTGLQDGRQEGSLG